MMDQDFAEISERRIQNMSAYLLDRINGYMFGREDLLTEWKREVYQQEFMI